MSTESSPAQTRLSRAVITLDGPSGSGKSSTARGVARALGLRYLDTGAQFRAMTLWMLENGIDIHDPSAVAAQTHLVPLESGTDPARPTISLAGRRIAKEIRGQAVTQAVSPVSAVPEVRARLLQLQREIIGSGGIVVEGRDIGSVVWPQAELKLYLTADPSARAQRRTRQSGAVDLAKTEADLLRRDQHDSSRSSAPLVVPDGAVHLDTTEYTLEQVINQVVAMVDEALAQP